MFLGYLEFFNIYYKTMEKFDLKNIIKEILLQELDGIMSNQAKQTRRASIQAEIKDLQQQLKDKQLQLSQIK